MNLDEITISSKTIYQGKVVHLLEDSVLLPNGKIATREVVKHPGGVCIVALTDNNELLMVRQFRYPYGKTLLEIPAGKLEKGEDPEQCGIRELREETGAIAKEFTFLSQMYPSPGYCNEIIHIYLAKGLTFKEQQLDEDEFLNVEFIALEKALQMVKNGEIKDSKTIIGIFTIALSEDNRYNPK